MPRTASHLSHKAHRTQAKRPSVAASRGDNKSQASIGASPGEDAPAKAADDGHRPGAGGWAAALRQPMSWGMQSLMALLHAGEEFQRAQLDCWHLALKRHEDVHRRLLRCDDASEMAALQAELLRFDTANLTHLSQRFMDTAVHMNTAMARSLASMMDGGRNNFIRTAMETLQSGMRTGVRPLDDMFNLPLLRELTQRSAGLGSATGNGQFSSEAPAPAQKAAAAKASVRSREEVEDLVS